MYAQTVLSEFSLGVTTIGAYHVVASATGVLMFCDWSRSTLAVSLSQYASGIIHGTCVQNGWAFALQRCGILFLHNPNLAIKDSEVPSSLCRHAGCSDDNNDAYYFEYY